MDSPQVTSLRAFGRIVLFLLACAGMLMAATPFAAQFPSEWRPLIIGLTTSAGVIALTLMFVRWDGLRLRDVAGAVNGRSLGGLAAGLSIGLSLVALHTCITSLVSPVHWTRVSAPAFETLLVTCLTFLLLSCREEFAFRGYPLRQLTSRIGIWQGQIVIAIVFALEHVAGGYSWQAAILGAGTASLLFSAATLASRGLALPIGIHAAWNIGDWLRGRGGGGYFKAIVEPGSEKQAELAGMTVYLMLILSAACSFYFWDWRRNKAGSEAPEATDPKLA